MPVFGLLAVVLRERQEVIGLTELCRYDVVESRDRLRAAPWQSRVRRRDHAEGLEVRGRDREVVRDQESLEPASEIAHLDRQARQDLLLDRDAETPI